VGFGADLNALVVSKSLPAWSVSAACDELRKRLKNGLEYRIRHTTIQEVEQAFVE
jgi:hypothetical protein